MPKAYVADVAPGPSPDAEPNIHADSLTVAKLHPNRYTLADGQSKSVPGTAGPNH